MLNLKKIENILLFLTLLFLPTQLGKHFWPQFSYIYSLRIDYLSPTLYFWDILVLALILVWIIRKPTVNKLALNIFLFFILTQVLSLQGAINLPASLVRLEQYMIAGIFGVYLSSNQYQSLARKYYLPLLLGILGESIVAILQFIKGSTLNLWIIGERTFSISTPGIAKFDFQGNQVLRPYATFPHPNVLAGFVLLGSSIIFQAQKLKSKLVSLVLVLGSVVVFLTMSRTVIFAGLISLLFVLRRRWIIFTIAVLLIVSPILLTRYLSILNFDNLALTRRQELIENAWQMVRISPLIGVGLNNFIPAASFNLITGPSRFLQPVHNIFMLALSETGVIGLIGLLILVGYPIVKIINHNFQIPHIRLLLPWSIIIFLGMFDHYLLTLPQGIRMLFLVWGISLSFVSSK